MNQRISLSTSSQRRVIVGVSLVAAFFSGYFAGNRGSNALERPSVVRSHAHHQTAAQFNERDPKGESRPGDDRESRDVPAVVDVVSLPRPLAAAVLQDVYSTETMEISRGFASILKLSDEEKTRTEEIVRNYVRELGLIEARNATLMQDETGEYYVLDPIADAGSIRRRFNDEILAALGHDKSRAETVANVLENSKALSGFGGARREVYVRDYTIEGQSFTSVEISSKLYADRKVSRSYTIGATSAFVAERYPFLKQSP